MDILKGSLVVSDEFEQYMIKLKEQYSLLPCEEKMELKQKMKKRNFLNYKKIEIIKAELLRLEAKRAQMELCEKEKDLALIEAKIRCKKEKLLKYLDKHVD